MKRCFSLFKRIVVLLILSLIIVPQFVSAAPSGDKPIITDITPSLAVHIQPEIGRAHV